MKFYYKCVRKEKERYFSAINHYNNVEYKIGGPAIPRIKGSKLFVFKDLDSASQFFYGSHIFKCHVKNPRKPKGISPLGGNDKAFWRQYHSKTPRGKHFNEWPEGTVLVDEVTLIEQIAFLKS